MTVTRLDIAYRPEMDDYMAVINGDTSNGVTGNTRDDVLCNVVRMQAVKLGLALYEETPRVLAWVEVREEGTGKATVVKGSQAINETHVAKLEALFEIPAGSAKQAVWLKRPLEDIIENNRSRLEMRPCAGDEFSAFDVFEGVKEIGPEGHEGYEAWFVRETVQSELVSAS